MKRARIMWLCLVLFAAGFGNCFGQEMRGHCAPEESVVFSCPMKKGSKVLSVCRSADFTYSTGYIQYRFGKPGNVEMQYPASLENSQDAFSYRLYSRSMVSYQDLLFRVGEIQYDVYDYYNGEEGVDQYDSGVVVTLADGREVKLECGPDVVRHLMEAGEFLPPADQ